MCSPRRARSSARLQRASARPCRRPGSDAAETGSMRALRMRRVGHIKRQAVTLVAVALGTLACGGGRSEEAPSLPVTVARSPDGVRHEQHSFSPDGKRIAYWSPAADSQNMQLWVANADLGSPVKLPVTAYFVAPAQWSPDGKSLAAGSAEFGFSQI